MPRTPRTPSPCPAPEDPPERLLTPRETAERIGVALKTLQNWALTWEVERRGPKPYRTSPGRGWVRYRESEVTQIVRDTLAGKQPLAPRHYTVRRSN